MSDNVSQLHAQKHPGLGKRIAVFALLLVLVAGGVAAYVFRDRLNLDAMQRYVRYLNVSDDSKTGRFVYDESNSNRYAGLSGGLAVASATGLSLYDKDGVETASIPASMSAPVLKTGGGRRRSPGAYDRMRPHRRRRSRTRLCRQFPHFRPHSV